MRVVELNMKKMNSHSKIIIIIYNFWFIHIYIHIYVCAHTQETYAHIYICACVYFILKISFLYQILTYIIKVMKNSYAEPTLLFNN